jgi:hypothetical protein
MSHERFWPSRHMTRPPVLRGCSQSGSFDGQDCVVINVMAQLRMSPSPPAAGRNAKLRRIVQLRAVRFAANCNRSKRPPRARWLVIRGTNWSFQLMPPCFGGSQCRVARECEQSTPTVIPWTILSETHQETRPGPLVVLTLLIPGRRSGVQPDPLMLCGVNRQGRCRCGFYARRCD